MTRAPTGVEDVPALADKAVAWCQSRGRRPCTLAEVRQAFLCYVANLPKRFCAPGVRPYTVLVDRIHCWVTSDVILTPDGPSVVAAQALNGERIGVLTEASLTGPYCPEFICCEDVWGQPPPMEDEAW